MMFFSPSPGQLVDRMSILRLKRLKAIETGRPVFAIEEELDRCGEELYKYTAGAALPKFVDLCLVLYTCNLEQWDRADEVGQLVKTLPEKPTYEQLQHIVAVEKLNALGNEERARLVQKIDELFGIEPEFKLYA